MGEWQLLQFYKLKLISFYKFFSAGIMAQAFALPQPG
jgi:hypothetical protein